MFKLKDINEINKRIVNSLFQQIAKLKMTKESVRMLSEGRTEHQEFPSSGKKPKKKGGNIISSV